MVFLPIFKGKNRVFVGIFFMEAVFEGSLPGVHNVSKVAIIHLTILHINISHKAKKCLVTGVMLTFYLPLIMLSSCVDYDYFII